MAIVLNGTTGLDSPALDTDALTIGGSAGTAGQVLTSNGSGSAPTWETPSAGSTIDYFDCYDTSTTNVNSGAVVPFSVTRQNSDGEIFGLSSGVVTISETGVYLFQFQITTQITSGTGRSSSYAWLEEDTGGGFSAVVGSYQYMYNRTLGLGENTGSSSLILSVTSGYDYRVYCTRYAGSDTVQTEPNASRLTIMKIA